MSTFEHSLRELVPCLPANRPIAAFAGPWGPIQNP